VVGEAHGEEAIGAGLLGDGASAHGGGATVLP